MLSKLIILALLLSGCVAVAIWHCYLKRGARLTFTFFFFAFLYILRWVLKNIASPSLLLRTNKQLTLSASLSNFEPVCHYAYLSLGGLITLLEWIFLFYIGWFVAERILQRFSTFSQRLFPSLLLSSLVTVSVLYPIEAIGQNLGWWHWQPFDQMFYDIFFIDCPSHSLKSGFYFALYFLAAYFLIECSKFKHKNWKMVFFILPFVHLWTIRFFGNGLPRVIERVGVFVMVMALTFLSALQLEDGKPSNLLKFKIMDRAFSWLFMFILAVLGFTMVFIINKPTLIFTLLPALFFWLFSMKKIMPKVIYIFCVLVLLIGKALAVVSLIPISIFFIFNVCDYSERNLKNGLKDSSGHMFF